MLIYLLWLCLYKKSLVSVGAKIMLLKADFLLLTEVLDIKRLISLVSNYNCLKKIINNYCITPKPEICHQGKYNDNFPIIHQVSFYLHYTACILQLFDIKTCMYITVNFPVCLLNRGCLQHC